MTTNPNQGNFSNMPLLTQTQITRGMTTMVDTEVGGGSAPQTVALALEQIAVGEVGYTAAVGATQGAAAPIVYATTIVTVTASTEGVRLPAIANTGQRRIIMVPGAVGVLVYPATGQKIDSSTTNAGVLIAAHKGATYYALKDLKTWSVLKTA